MKTNILVALTLLMLSSSVPAVDADEASVEQKLSEATTKVDTSHQSGKLSAKTANNLKAEGDKLAKAVEVSKSNNKGALSDGDKTKYCNKVKAFDEKVSRAAFPDRTSDEKSLATVRKAIMKAKGLSSDAQNVKLSFEDGILVLDGPVKSEAEKEKLVNIAKSAGASQVSCKLSVTQ
ncbi:MAG: BON domain-containing protein [Candidatus Melainabacteria bacterium]|nr:BON domain-containing protein [Candidatus Melainabacteria bacterium]